jgi:hypothetical protein
MYAPPFPEKFKSNYLYDKIFLKKYQVIRLESKELSYKLIDVLNKWDPFNMGEGEFDPEIADILQAVHDYDDADKVARRIQSVFEFSFEHVLPYKKCLSVANTLLAIKNEDVCSL